MAEQVNAVVNKRMTSIIAHADTTRDSLRAGDVNMSKNSPPATHSTRARPRDDYISRAMKEKIKSTV